MSFQVRNKRKLNEGSAMIVAIVVGVVIMAFSLSLLLAAYSLFYSTTRQSTQVQCKELAKSVSKELKQELMQTSYHDYEEQRAAAGNENNLWFFLRYNLWQEEAWPYYHDGETGHTETDSYRYFTVDAADASGFEGMADKILITMYWEIESDEPSSETDKALTVLHIQVETEKDDCTYTMESAYALTVVPYDNDVDYEDMESIENTTINPYHKSIAINEQWMWSPD